MGNHQSLICSDFANLVKPGNNIKNIVTDSGSSQIFFLQLKDDQNVVLKLFLINEESKSLQYEKCVYENINNLIINQKINPFFLNYITGSNECSFEDIAQIFTNNVYNNTNPYTINNSRFLLYKITTNLLIERPFNENINNIKHINNINYDNLKRLRYGLIVTKKEENYKLENWIFDYLKPSSIDNYIDDFLKIILLIVTAIYSLTLFNTNHNDLHLNNILIKKLQNPQNYIFAFTSNNKNVQFIIKDVKYIPIIYDFDRAYCKFIGKNPGLIGNNLCKIYSQCNIFKPKLDLVKIYVQMLYTLKKIFKKEDINLDKINQILSYIFYTKYKDNYNYIYKFFVYKEGTNLIHAIRKSPITNEELNLLNDSTEIIKNILNLLNINLSENVSDNILDNPNFFNMTENYVENIKNSLNINNHCSKFKH